MITTIMYDFLPELILQFFRWKSVKGILEYGWDNI